jgi:hypothetical protein
MTTCKPLATPHNASVKLSKGQNPSSMEEQCEMVNVPYKAVVGSFMYYMVGTRPDLVVVVGIVA